MMRSLRYGTAAMAIAALTTVACGGKKPETAPPPPPPPAEEKATPTPPPPPPPPAPKPEPKAPTDDEIYAKMTFEDIAAKYLTDVFFAFDSIELTDQARGAVQKNAEFMKRRPTAQILIEGHADARGTNEYNLALGERRAGAVRDYMVSLGVAADRIKIVSKGEEQPFCREETETCWQQNRRGHYVVTAR